MFNIVSKCEIILYADDTLICMEADTNDESHNNLDVDRKNIDVVANE